MAIRGLLLLLLFIPTTICFADTTAKETTLDDLASDLRELIDPANAEKRTQFDRILADRGSELDRLVRLAEFCFPELTTIRQQGAASHSAPPIPWPMLPGLAEPERLIANLNLYVGREIVRAGLADEGLALLQTVDAEMVVDRAALHFHTAVAAFQTRQKEPALHALAELEVLPDVPARYRDTAQILRDEMEAWKPESLSAIASDMRRVSRRLDNGRTDDTVQTLENDVVSRLDKMIEELEKQQQKQQQNQSSNQPNAPMEDSKLPDGGEGTGEVENRILKISSDWGKLPEKEREKAMQQLDRRFPEHYREAVEEYFRKLADSEGRK